MWFWLLNKVISYNQLVKNTTHNHLLYRFYFHHTLKNNHHNGYRHIHWYKIDLLHIHHDLHMVHLRSKKKEFFFLRIIIFFFFTFWIFFVHLHAWQVNIWILWLFFKVIQHPHHCGLQLKSSNKEQKKRLKEIKRRIGERLFYCYF